ncbi:unnamed protein product, partial [Rotaria sp. Silwood2]
SGKGAALVACVAELNSTEVLVKNDKETIDSKNDE